MNNISRTKIAIVTDSISCLTRELATKYQIHVVPAVIIYHEGKTYRDWVDITPSEAYRIVETAPEQFRTGPQVGEFVQAFRDLAPKANCIFCITISSKISTMYNVAQVAAEQVKTEFPNISIEIFDSYTAAAAQGLIALAAARTALKGEELDKVLQVAKRVSERVNAAYAFETIRYVYRSGRVPEAAAILGAKLNIKPLITIRDGLVHIMGVSRTKEKAIESILKFMKQKVNDKPIHAAVIHADVPDEAQKLKEKVTSEFNCLDETWIAEFSPVMAYATGRGVVGVAFYPEENDVA